MAYENRFATDSHSRDYVKYRPRYPTELYDVIFNEIDKKFRTCSSPRKELAVDIGCGSGQNAMSLGPWFNKVIGYDISETQIAEARKLNTCQNVEYRVGGFDKMDVGNSTTDLVTTAQAAHWFQPITKYYEEVDRILKPGGVLAIFGYTWPDIYKGESHLEEFTTLMKKHSHDPRLIELWDAPLFVGEGGLRDFVLPYAGWRRMDNLDIKMSSSLMGVIRFLNTITAAVQFKQNNPGTPGPLEELEKRFVEMIGPDVSLEDYKCEMRFPIYLLLGKKPLT